MSKLLEGKYALITGGGRGIGKAVALEFAKNGANVAIAALEKDELDQTIREIEKYGVKSFSIPVDLSTLDGVKYCASKYLKSFQKCDILVPNAGISLYSTILEYSLEEAQKLFNLNIMGYYGIIKLILPSIIKQGGGNIIMTSSVEGNVLFTPRKVPYSTSKAAITAMGKTLQAEVRHQNVQVNVVMPGGIQTKIIEENVKRGQVYPFDTFYSEYTEFPPPEAISPIYLFLASDLSKSNYMGKVINQWVLFELLPKLRKEISRKDYEIETFIVSMKEKLKKDIYNFLKKNEELVDFMLKYEG
ncbi:MAG: SDR family NAD(P)-dependent oxidoreductase [Promethearchaeota archaeon]